jgi:hypothetical protein
MGKIRWLHVSDVHCGQAGKSRWDQLKDAALTDIRAQVKKAGVPDLLILTGDLAYSGRVDEYHLVDRLLEELREATGGDPIVVPVPGNHDMERPGELRPITRCGLRNYLNDAENIRPALLEGTPEVRDIVASLFKNYMDWFARAIEPQWRARAVLYERGPVAGDFRATFSNDGIVLGIVGVNSAFLHFENASEKMVVEMTQHGPDAPSWVKRRDANLLLMHHPLDWLDRSVRQDCYEPTRYVACLFGHMHTAEAEQTLSGSSHAIRRFCQASSLFGLEHYGRSREVRACGYSLGSLTKTKAGFRLSVRARRYESGNFSNDKAGSVVSYPRANPRPAGAQVVVFSFGDRVAPFQSEVARELETVSGVASVKLSNANEAQFLTGSPASIVVALVGDASRDPLPLAHLVRDPATIFLLGPGCDASDDGRELLGKLGASSVATTIGEACSLARGRVQARVQVRSTRAAIRVGTAEEPSSMPGDDAQLDYIKREAQAAFVRGDFAAALSGFRVILEQAVSVPAEPLDVQKALLNVATALVYLGRVSDATATLAEVELGKLDGALRARYATLLVYCNQPARARDILLGDSSVDAEKVLQLIELREGKIPVDFHPDLRLDVAQVMIARGNMLEAARLAMEVMDDASGRT